MGELTSRRRNLFSGAAFKTALFYSGDGPGRANANFRYFSGCSIDGGYLVVKPGGGKILTHEMNCRLAAAVSPYPVKLLGKDGAKTLRAEAGAGKIGFAYWEISAARFFALKKKARLRLVDAGPKAFEARGSKSAGEMRLLVASAKIARRILAELQPWEHDTEAGLASSLKIAALKAGAEISFEPIVATGKNTAYPHHLPSEKKLEDSVLVDFGVRYQGYCSDFTRCYFRGKRKREKETYEKCESVFWQLLEELPGCEKGRDAAELSDRLLKRHGLPKLPHSIGHGIGLEVHEYPHLGKHSQDRLRAGTVLAIEPAAYFSDYGARFEEMVGNTGKGWRLL